MVTIGDVFAIIFTLIGIGLTTWALMVSCTLLFPNAVSRASEISKTEVKSNLGFGLLLLIPSVFGVAVLGNPNPLTKFAGLVVLLGALACVAIGAAGIGQIAGDRIREMDSSMGEYPSMIRGCALLVTASMLPLLGWFLFGPLVILASLGAGFRSLKSRVRMRQTPSAINGTV